jgi:hypothetical protein
VDPAKLILTDGLSFLESHFRFRRLAQPTVGLCKQDIRGRVFGIQVNGRLKVLRRFVELIFANPPPPQLILSTT